MQQNDRDQDMGSMTKSMIIVMLFTMIGKVTGFLREMVLAGRFSVSYATDAYKSANDLPCFFLSIIVTALSFTLMPAYSQQLKQGRNQANRFISNLFTVGMALSVVVLLLTLVYLEPIVRHIWLPHASPETQDLTIRLSRVMMPMGLFVFLARLSSAYLQANFSFTVPAVSQILLNITVIIAIFFAGENITYVAIGTVVGWVLQYAVQIPKMGRVGFRYKPVFDFSEPGLREVAILMLPVLMSSAFDQLYFIFDRAVASTNEGHITVLDYGNRISTMASSVLLTTIATVLYPNLVRNVEKKNRFTEDLGFGLSLNLLIALPMTVALIILSVPVTRLVYERGAFSSNETFITAGTLACYSAGILGVGIRELCNRSFYAFKNTKIPTIVGICAVALNIALNYALYPVFGAPGIAAGTSISSVASGAALLYMLHRSKQVINWHRVGACFWKTAVATAAMTAVLILCDQLLHLHSVTGMMPFLLSMLATFVLGVLVYLVALKLLRAEELDAALRFVKEKLRSPRKRGVDA